MKQHAHIPLSAILLIVFLMFRPGGLLQIGKLQIDMIRERPVAWLRMLAVSTISTMNVLRPRASSSLAPTRAKTRSAMPTRALRAGTNEPIWAITSVRAAWRM